MILKCMWKCKRPRILKIILKKEQKMEDLYYLISGFSLKLQWWIIQCCIGVKTDKQSNGTL